MRELERERRTPWETSTSLSKLLREYMSPVGFLVSVVTVDNSLIMRTQHPGHARPVPSAESSPLDEQPIVYSCRISPSPPTCGGSPCLARIVSYARAQKSPDCLCSGVRFWNAHHGTRAACVSLEYAFFLGSYSWTTLVVASAKLALLCPACGC